MRITKKKNYKQSGSYVEGRKVGVRRLFLKTYKKLVTIPVKFSSAKLNKI